MIRRTLLLAVAGALAFSAVGATADEGVPVHDPAAVAEVIPGGACTPESRFDAPDRYYVDANGQLVTNKWGETADGTPAAEAGTSVCERLNVVFGPILVKPGQNDVLIQPVTFEKPMYDGYLVRFQPNLVDAFGTPPVEDLHLHHGTWLNTTPSYGVDTNIWIASGEEKTIATWPHRFGIHIGARDSWLFLHMIHSALPTPRVVWVTYSIDFIPKAVADVVQADGKPLVRNTKGIWLDVGAGRFHPQAEPYPLNPVFNIQRGHGGVVDPQAGEHTLELYGDHYGDVTAMECLYPAQNCARFNSQNNRSAQQGIPVNVAGKDWRFPASFGEGTLILMGGHLHNGGLRDEVELVRDGESRLIHISDAYYWKHEQEQLADGTNLAAGDPRIGELVGGPPVSWDFSMSGVSYDLGWAVNVRGGDILRLNGVYDSSLGSWYEQMGIVMAWVVPGETFGRDVFAKDGNGDYVVDLGYGLPTTSQAVPYDADGEPLPTTCTPSATLLCLRGQITHPHYSTSGNHALIGRDSAVPDNRDIDGPLLQGEIAIGGFLFGPFDMGVTGVQGIPRLVKDQKIRITNLDTADYVWHTLTRCAAPCTGRTTASFPIPDGAYQDLLDDTWGTGAAAADGKTLNDLLLEGPDVMDFDSAELGVGAAPSGKAWWDFTPTRTGTFTFFCRIHPFMRGVFEVVDAA